MTASADPSVAGNHDRWILLERRTKDGYPLIVRVRTGNSLVDQALVEAAITVVRCQAAIELVDDNGLPQHSDRCYSLEDGLASELEALGVGAFHVASVTGEGERRLIYAHSGPLEFEPLLSLFPVEGYALSTAMEDQTRLIELIMPTRVDEQLNGDLAVISNLKAHGDNGSVPRKTDFWFYGPTSGLQQVVAELGPWGYIVDHWINDPTGVVLSSETPVDFGSFREVTPVLVATAERHGVTYDGWETLVLQDEPPPTAQPSISAKPKSLLSKLFGAKKN